MNLQVDYHYRYRFMAPDNDNYEMSFVEFNTEKLENYNWNYLDYYVATRGDQEEFVLGEKLKHWRFRLYVLPVLPFLAATAATRDSGQGARCDGHTASSSLFSSSRCDGYTAPTAEERVNMAEGFLRWDKQIREEIKSSSGSLRLASTRSSGQVVSPRTCRGRRAGATPWRWGSSSTPTS